jgi:peptidoglycan/LPS O-acetylase OafA/YrhL
MAEESVGTDGKNAAETEGGSGCVKKADDGNKNLTGSALDGEIGKSRTGSIAIGRSGFLNGLDGIRAIACLAVIFHHIAQKLSAQIQPALIREIDAFLLMGNSGVSIFFVLSGFLLSYPFWKNFLNSGGFPDMKQYALRRAARIMPGYYASFLVCSLLIPVFGISSPNFWTRVLAGITFTAGFSYKTFFPNEINGPFWSVSFEVFCYILMPVFMYAMFTVIRKKRTLPRALAFWAGVALLNGLMNQMVHILLTPDNIRRGWQFGMTGGAKYWMPNYNPIGFFGHFIIGIMACGVSAGLFCAPDAAERFRKKGGFDIVCIVGLLGSFALLWFLRHAPEFSFSIQDQPYFFPFYALLIGITLIAAPHSMFAGKLLDNAFFRFTAKVSFGLYIWHYLIMFIATNTFFRSYQNYSMTSLGQWAGISLLVIAVSYAAAALSYRFIEKPVLDWAHKRTPGGKRLQCQPQLTIEQKS